MSTQQRSNSPTVSLLSTIPRSSRATYLMCPPTLYDVNYVINPWMAGNVHASSRERAAQQWQRLYEAVSKIADVELIEPQPGSPDMVFTANAGLERNGIVALSSFFHPERQGEEQHFRRWFQKPATPSSTSPAPPHSKAKASSLLHRRHPPLGGPRPPHRSSPATTPSAKPGTSKSCRFTSSTHASTTSTPASPHSKTATSCTFPKPSTTSRFAAIEAFYPPEKRIIVSESDAVHFACNAINIGRTIILNTISRELTDQLEQLGFHVVQVELTEFLKAGGAAKCLVMKTQPRGSTIQQERD